MAGFTPKYQQAARWFAVKNTTNETIPSYAVMRLGDGRDYTVGVQPIPHVEKDGGVVFEVSKPNQDSADHQRLGLHCFNGHTSIPPHSYGEATQDYPARVLFDGNTATDGTLGQLAGIVSGGWKLSNTQDSLVSLGHAHGAPRVGAERAIWVNPNPEHRREIAAVILDGIVTVADSDEYQLRSVGASFTNRLRTNGAAPEWSTNQNGFVIKTDGVYHLKFHASVSMGTTSFAAFYARASNSQFSNQTVACAEISQSAVSGTVTIDYTTYDLDMTYGGLIGNVTVETYVELEKDAVVKMWGEATPITSYPTSFTLKCPLFTLERVYSLNTTYSVGAFPNS